MSILKKPYEISVWDDVWDTAKGKFVEKRLGIIGSDKMLSQSRATKPQLTRNVNGTKKFSFQMYRYYIDNETGEKVENEFVSWLIGERKVKLKYDGVWYDFIVKQINENSSNYLYTYQLEDALVQELSKNGFGVTLDAALMNNIGDAKQLATKTLLETDWNVDSEVFVQTIEENLVHLYFPQSFSGKVYHLIDQTAPYSVGVREVELKSEEMPRGKRILAFYSSCKNKPHRFQFIYLENLPTEKKNKDSIKLNSNRAIIEKDCQYYIDFEDPSMAYSKEPENEFGFYLPTGFSIVNPGTGTNYDTKISSWYKGLRYGYAQQSVYVPVLEKYCSKFSRHEQIPLIYKNNIFASAESEGDFSASFSINNNLVESIVMEKDTPWTGVYFTLPYYKKDTYIVKYTLSEITNLKRIGGHASHYAPLYYKINNVIRAHSGDPTFVLVNSSDIKDGKIEVEIAYQRKESNDGNSGLYIQPNRGLTDDVKCKISNLSLEITGDYLGYTESTFVSPTLVQNYITGYNFESVGGWTASTEPQYAMTSDKKAKVETVYGRFAGTGSNTHFINIVDDFFEGDYKDTITYTPYLKMSINNQYQFVLNSGIKDNRSVIQQINKNEEWIVDYYVVNDKNERIECDFELGNYEYNTKLGGHDKKDGITFVVTNKNNSTCHFKVQDTEYTTETFKKNSRIFLKIKPASSSLANCNTFYIKEIKMYKKVLDKKGQIIVPDYEAKNSEAARATLDASGVDNTYHYFESYLVDPEEDGCITSADQLKTIATNKLDYKIYSPVYNEGAKKVRSVSAKESNYFNILQSIAQTFEAWLVLEIERDSFGAVQSKTVHFKNYAGDNNYASFRYGVNLKDIQRNTVSTNIVTKLIVKQNANELGKDGFCTIQRAGANPSGENYIYDFQYYQNKGIMSPDEYLKTCYYMNGAQGPDGVLWKDESGNAGPVADSTTYTLKGYFPRIKALNDAIIPINEQLIGLQKDLIQRKAEQTIVDTTIETAAEGIQETKESFYALTGLYPDEIQLSDIESVTLGFTETVDGQEKTFPGVQPNNDQNWWNYATSKVNNTTYKVSITAKKSDRKMAYVINNSSLEKYNVISGGYEITKNTQWSGLYIDAFYSIGSKYRLQYTVTFKEDVTGEKLINIGGHNQSFNGYVIKLYNKGNLIKTGTTGSSIIEYGFSANVPYTVEVTGTFNGSDSDKSPWLWIQPNRGETQRVHCIIEDITLYEIDGTPAETGHDRTASFYINAAVKIKGVGTPVHRTYTKKCVVPANKKTGEVVQAFTSIDNDRSDIRQYIEEYTTYYEKLKEAEKQKPSLDATIAQKENEIKQLEDKRQNYLDYKATLNTMFFEKYSRFIQEGTWISEEYVDDEKYYADALSVMYNSCYPKVSYTINVIAISALEGYEDFVFKLGDKTYAIDPEFFGESAREEVVITETIESLDDPNANQIKVQNFKNQFQDLFQKITATVQQTQYNEGMYKKGGALLEASASEQNAFIQNALSSAETFLSSGRTHDVNLGQDGTGLTVTDTTDRTNQIRIVGGAILLSRKDEETGELVWRTGLTNQGMSAELITAGRIDVGKIQIMAGDSPVFKWDAYGISAYDAYWNDVDYSTISGVNPNKFVRFDKYGIYGINSTSINGESWHPTGRSEDALKEIDKYSTFALTWAGLKVTGNESVVAHFGRLDGNIVKITKTMNTANGTKIKDLFSVTNEGNVHFGASANEFDGQDNLLIRSQDFFHSSWKGLDHWLTSYDSQGFAFTDSNYNVVKETGCYIKLGQQLKTPPQNTKGIYQSIVAEKGITYTFSFNASVRVATPSKVSFDADSGLISVSSSGNYQMGGLLKEYYAVQVYENNSFKAQQLFCLNKDETEQRFSFEWTFSGEDGQKLDFVICHSPWIDDSNDLTNMTDNDLPKTGQWAQMGTICSYRTKKEDEYINYMNANILRVSSFKVSRFTEAESGTSAKEWTPHYLDGTNQQLGGTNILRTKFGDEGGNYNIANYYIPMWKSNYNEALEEELTNYFDYRDSSSAEFTKKTIKKGTYLFTLTGQTENIDVTNPSYDVLSTHQINATLIPLKYKLTDQGYQVVNGDWSRTVCLNTSFESKHFTYQDLDIDFYSPDYPDSEYVGWRIAFTNEPKKGGYGKVYDFTIEEIVPLNPSTALSGQNADDAIRKATSEVITKTTKYFAISAYGTDPGTVTWYTEMPTLTTSKPYLWCKDAYEYGNGKKSESKPYVVTYKAKDGAPGKDGKDGATGSGTNAFVKQQALYMLTNSPNTPSIPANSTGYLDADKAKWYTDPSDALSSYKLGTWVASFIPSTKEYGEYYYFTCIQSHWLDQNGKDYFDVSTPQRDINLENNLDFNHWREATEGNNTLIDGSKIYTGSVMAGQIKVFSQYEQKDEANSTPIFFAGYDPSTKAGLVQMCGWDVDNTGLQKGSGIGTEGSCYILTSSLQAKGVFGCGENTERNWLFGIGRNFGVTDNGTLYCSDIQATGGKIANIEIKHSKLWDTTGAVTHLYSPGYYTLADSLTRSAPFYLRDDGIIGQYTGDTFVGFERGAFCIKTGTDYKLSFGPNVISAPSLSLVTGGTKSVSIDKLYNCLQTLLGDNYKIRFGKQANAGKDVYTVTVDDLTSISHVQITLVGKTNGTNYETENAPYVKTISGNTFTVETYSKSTFGFYYLVIGE